MYKLNISRKGLEYAAKLEESVDLVAGYTEREKQMKFGDIVINHWAGNKNQHKVLMFLRKRNKLIHCLALDGEEVLFTDDKNLRLEIIDSLELCLWKDIADEIRSESD